jgi:hypothetical protein
VLGAAVERSLGDGSRNICEARSLEPGDALAVAPRDAVADSDPDVPSVSFPWLVAAGSALAGGLLIFSEV